MTRRLRQVAAAVGLAALAFPSFCADPLPHWAYPVNPPGLKPAADDGVARRVPGSNVSFTLTQIRDLYVAPDWHPDDHPPMPGVVGTGRKPGLFACAYCHLPNALGRPENASLAGLPAEYIVQQVQEFRSGARRSSEPDSLPVNLMVAVAKAVDDAELKVAAEYFARLQPRPWIRVVETDSVPRTHVAGWMLVANEPREMEPIGTRIVEVPEDLERTELRDSKSGFIAYVPSGSIARGEALVTEGRGKVLACGGCHGADLRGLGPVPALAGRSPSYVVRQLYDIKHGARRGAWTPLMQGVAESLSIADMVDIAAYTASRAP
jgi:cytochrome c553